MTDRRATAEAFHAARGAGSAAAAGLLSLDQACARAASFVRPIPDAETVPLSAAVGRVLARPLMARIAIPPFTQSAMDGYAILAGQGLAAGTGLIVIDRIPAGHPGRPLGAGEAARIFTGAPLPEGADAVIMQEHVLGDAGRIVLGREIRAGDNVRPRGEDIDPPELILAKGTRLDPRHIGLIAAQGYCDVTVVARPRIAVVSTGDELRQPGDRLAPATIYDSNRLMLLALITAAGFEARDGGWVPDAPQAIAERLGSLAGDTDLIVTTGGASAGDEDHSATALTLAGGLGGALRIALKPGKPAVVGRIGATGYLGLPGNPVASLVTWMLLGQAMTSALTGARSHRDRGYPLKSLSWYRRRPGRTEFVPAILSEDAQGLIGIEILGRGGSARLRPLAIADGLAEIPPQADGIEPGDELHFHPFRSII
ncbi:gephyrin-like molybdotransferase Glp [Phreatobacter stygius]|uniref:Molybdopterin molybdenumtransferase n=1 Tax=Phreatobacter stygius TaxID=1940610 RepID=A0A4D7BFZ0_9HYPH|nr:gephyrin-like molybdotransferase Glp [Phreatobacter stygius]QCI68728.1 molybdopterin molybdotransferase MoeA [Phreatobacter stygius]